MLRALSRALSFERHRSWILIASLVVTVLGVLGAMRLPLRSDLSSLLPPSKRSVQDLDVLRQRARSFGNVLVMVDGPTPAVREVAARELEGKLRAIDRSLVTSVSVDDNTAARYGWEHRFLFAELAELTQARDALEERLLRARLDNNPLFIELDERSPNPGKDLDDQLASIERRLDEAERAAKQPAARLSQDGRSQLFALNVTFPSSDISSGRKVMGIVRGIGAELEAAHAGVRVEYAGNINISIFEHDSVIAGMLRAAAVTVILVGLGLFLYYRSMWLILAGLWSLAVGVSATLGFAYLAIGHLNLLSAFLTAIVIGNGINPGLIILSRYAEELRAGTEPREAIAPALRSSLPGTLGASLAASVAYAALIVTDFRGFRHFGIIGGVGMILCWFAAFTVLPAALDWLARRDKIEPTPAPRLGHLLGKLGGARITWVLGIGAAVTLASLAVTVSFIVNDPFEKDWRDLQADGGEISAQREVDKRMSARFDRGVLGGHSYQLAIGVNDRSEVRAYVAKLRELEKQRPAGQELFTDIKSIDDLVPADQDAKLVLLEELRGLLGDPLIASLEPALRDRLTRLMPPPNLRALTERDVPEDLLRAFIEKDGTVGRLIYVKGSRRFQTWNVDDRVAFAAEVDKLPRTPGGIIAGEPLVIADIVESMERDAPLMIAVSLLGAILIVGFSVGLRRHGAITLICGLAGVIVMIALCDAAGLKVHFLDLIALPITIGIGIDYAINLAARDREEPGLGPRALLATTGGAVIMCSFTTMVGYGSLLLSSNGGVRSFGLAAILGEVACLATAVLIAPALLSRTRR